MPVRPRTRALITVTAVVSSLAALPVSPFAAVAAAPFGALGAIAIGAPVAAWADRHHWDAAWQAVVAGLLSAAAAGALGSWTRATTVLA